MENQIKILHIAPDYKIVYFIIRKGASIHSTVSLEQALGLLKKEEFDLIISEPHNKAILTPQNHLKNGI